LETIETPIEPPVLRAALIKAEAWSVFVLQHPCRSRRQANLQEVPGTAAPIKWVVYCKEPFAGPQQVLRYLSRYTHRVAISNCRLIAADDGGVSFRWKDYRIEGCMVSSLPASENLHMSKTFRRRP
jgi:hypothetical protein